MNKSASSITIAHEYISFYRKLRPKHPILVGISAVQGCGKTTLTNGLCSQYKDEGLKAVAISLDDFYLPRNKQDELAKSSNNSLLEYRGNAGTHDVDILNKTLDALLKLPTTAVFKEVSNVDSGRCVHIPTFDKSKYNGLGDRSHIDQWTLVEDCIDVILVEGWMLGFSPIYSQNVNSNLNPNPHHVRNYSRIVDDYPGYAQVNECMKLYEYLNKLMDIWIILALEIDTQTPDDYILLNKSHIDPASGNSNSNMETIEDVIYKWRREAEHKMIESTSVSSTSTTSVPASSINGMSDTKLREFVSKFMPAYYTCLPAMYCIAHSICGPIRKQLRSEYNQHRMVLENPNIPLKIVDPWIEKHTSKSEAESEPELESDSEIFDPVLAPVLKIYVDNKRSPLRMEYI